MPTYEYECRACGERFERIQSFRDEPIRVCPACGGETRRVFQPVGVIFKGSGWYINDSRKRPSESKPAGGEHSTEPKPSAEPKKEPAASDGGGSAPATPTKAGGDG